MGRRSSAWCFASRDVFKAMRRNQLVARDFLLNQCDANHTVMDATEVRTGEQQTVLDAGMSNSHTATRKQSFTRNNAEGRSLVNEDTADNLEETRESRGKNMRPL